MKLPSVRFGQRFLIAYSGLLTAVVAVALLSGFAGAPGAQRFDEITVQRINLVEPDGTLRMIITDKAHTPGIFLKGVEHLPGFHQSAGLVFFNDEGTENGGLIFGGSKDRTGKVSSYGHLSFDQYMQDQVMTLDAGETNGQRSSAIALIDRPDWDITEAVELLERIQHLPPDQQKAATDAFNASHPPAQSRAFFGRAGDSSAALRLKDAQGRDRVVLSVPATGDPQLQFLDAAGHVTRQLP